MLAGIGALFGLVRAAAASAVTGIEGYFRSAAADIAQAVSRTTTESADLAITAIRNVATTINAVAQAAADGVKIALERIAALERSVEQDIAHLAERARQYQLARLAANPFAVFAEWFVAAHRASGRLSLPDPNAGAPWAVLDWLRQDLLAYEADRTHPVRLALEEARADMAAAATGTPPTIPSVPASPLDVDTFPRLTDPRGVDVDARGLLIQTDRDDVAQTTSAGGGSHAR